MMLLAALVLAGQERATAADFFPLTPGLRRVYEEMGERKNTVVDEVGAKPVFFDGKPAYAIVRKNRFNEPMDVTYYRVDGPTVFIVGFGEDRRAATPTIGQATDPKTTDRSNVLLSLIPAMPIFRYDGSTTEWSYIEVPRIKAAGDLEAKRGDETEIHGVTKPGKERLVLGKKVETIEVRAEILIGIGPLGQKRVETSVYGRGIGLVETTIRTTSGNKTVEAKTTLVSMNEKREGG